MYCPSIKAHLQAMTGTTYPPEQGPLPLQFNVSFILNSRSLFYMHAAVSTLAASCSVVTGGESPSADQNSGKLDVSSLFIATPSASLRGEERLGLVRRWLFPEVKDMEELSVMQVRGSNISDREWIDQGLNPEQRVSSLDSKRSCKLTKCVCIPRTPCPALHSTAYPSRTL